MPADSKALTGGGRGLARGLGGQLLAGRLAAGRLAGSLLGASHVELHRQKRQSGSVLCSEGSHGVEPKDLTKQQNNLNAGKEPTGTRFEQMICRQFGTAVRHRRTCVCKTKAAASAPIKGKEGGRRGARAPYCWGGERREQKGAGERRLTSQKHHARP